MEQAFTGYLHMYLSLKDTIMSWMPWIRIGRKLDSFLHVTNCEIIYHDVHIPGKARKCRVMFSLILTLCPPKQI